MPISVLAKGVATSRVLLNSTSIPPRSTISPPEDATRLLLMRESRVLISPWWVPPLHKSGLVKGFRIDPSRERLPKVVSNRLLHLSSAVEAVNHDVRHGRASFLISNRMLK